MQHITHEEFAEAFPCIFDTLYRYVRIRVAHTQDTEDIVAHTVETMIRRLATYDPTQGALEAWAFGIAKRNILHYWRDRRPLVELAAAENIASNFTTNDADRTLDWSRIADTLTSEQRALLVLRYVDGYSSEEIATQSGKTAASIRKQLCNI
jgi:RNA polymerase sigma factor (sigma-70 family)